MDIKVILKNHKLRVTECRQDVLEFFLKKKQALTQKDLEDSLTAYDRVTLYRTLHSFLDNGILHKIPNDNGIASYGMCFQTCGPEEHHHNHVHFNCVKCGKMECIQGTITIPTIKLPDHYRLKEIDIIVKGTCLSCNISPV